MNPNSPANPLTFAIEPAIFCAQHESMHISLQSFTITNSLYNLPNDEFITVQVIQTPDPEITEPELDPESIEEYTFELPKGTWRVEDICDLWNEQSAETTIEWFYDEHQNKLNIFYATPTEEEETNLSDFYSFQYSIVDGSAYLLYMLGLEADGIVQEETYIGPYQVYLTNHFNIYLRCTNLNIPSQVCGWPQTGENILARIPVETALGSVYHYEPQNAVASNFRSGTLSQITLEMLREDGTVLEVEPDTEWTVTLEFNITRADTAAAAPTSYQNAQAFQHTTETLTGEDRDFLKRGFDVFD